MSLPTRERGLKYAAYHRGKSAAGSLPTRERGLKYAGFQGFRLYPMSLPTRERGLKYVVCKQAVALCGRSLHGSVD